MHTYIHTYLLTHIHTYIHTCIHTYMHSCMRACVHAYIHNAYILIQYTPQCPMLGKVPVLDVLLLFEAGCLADGTPAEATALGLGFMFRGFGLRVCGSIFRC